jgi:hypothetical protein
VTEDVNRPLAVADRQVERLAGLAVVDGDRHVTVVWVPEQADVDSVADAGVELAGARGALGLERVRICRASILDVWIDHLAFPQIA